MEGHRETKAPFIGNLVLFKGHRGTGRDTRLRSDCGQNTRSMKDVFTIVKSSYLRRSRVFGNGGPWKRKLFS
jgi:hypothetical protein